MVDVGANDGQYARMLRHDVGFSGRIASVEPSSQAFDRLATAMDRDLRWEGFNFALGDETGTVTLNVLESDDFTSIHQVSSYARTRFTRLDVIGQEAVTIHRLDEVFDDLAAGHDRVFVKADTQGHDIAVVSGLGERRAAALQIELSIRSIYEGTLGYLDAIRELEVSGYRPSAFFPVSRTADGLSIIEMDGVFVCAAVCE